MQRVEVKISEEEYIIMKKWFEKERVIIEEIEKEIFIESDGEKVFLNFSRVSNGGMLLKIKSSKKYMVDNGVKVDLESFFVRGLSDLIGVFSLSSKYLKEEVFIRFIKEYKKNGYYKSYKEHKQVELNTIKCFTQSINTHNLFTCIKYFDFESKEELLLAVYLYINYAVCYRRVDEIEEFTKFKMEMLGYERNVALKDKRPIYERKDKINMEYASLKSLNYTFENLLEVFYKLVNNEIEESLLAVKKYTCVLAKHYVSNSNH